jgi:two-component system chemotaxis response regulator CheY
MAKILIVDDAVFMRKMLSDILTKDGHQIVGEAENAKEAINLYKKLKPDIVTLDIIMPDVEGINATKAIKEITAEDPNAKILMVSAMGQQEMVVESIQAGAKDFIVKPFQPSNVTSAVKRLLKR